MRRWELLDQCVCVCVCVCVCARACVWHSSPLSVPPLRQWCQHRRYGKSRTGAGVRVRACVHVRKHSIPSVDSLVHALTFSPPPPPWQPFPAIPNNQLAPLRLRRETATQGDGNPGRREPRETQSCLLERFASLKKCLKVVLMSAILE